MNKVLSIVLLFAFSAAHAQLSSSTPYQPENSSKGFRVSFLRPAIKIEGKSNRTSGAVTETIKSSEQIKNTIGIGLGIANLPVSEIGYTGQLGFLQMEDKAYDNRTVKIGLLRADGNVAWTFTENFHMKGGLNLGRLVKIEKDTSVIDWGLGLGPQAGVGFQITRNFGIDLMYYSTEFRYSKKYSSANKYKSEITVAGIEIDLTGTF